MRTTTKNPDPTPIPVQLAEDECNALSWPYLSSMPTRGPKCTIGSQRVWTRIVWVLYTGMPWQCVPMPQDAPGQPAIHDTNVYRALAQGAAEASRQQACSASVGHRLAEKTRDVRILHGDGPNTVAKTGERGWATLVTSQLVASFRHDRNASD